jgi:signal transduction histidine kinase
MKSANIPESEVERLKTLLDYQVLDTDPEDSFDELTNLAASVCGIPISLVSLIDETRQWFKSHHGLKATETPREIAFCSHAILQDDIFEVSDSRQDERFYDNPLVTDDPNVIFYAGAPLITPEGHCVGTLCVIDHKPKTLSSTQRQQLRIIANQVVAQLELRKSNRLKNELIDNLSVLVEQVNRKNDELYQFSHRVAHDISAPLRHISTFSELSIKDIKAGNSDEALEKYQFIVDACSKLKTLLKDILHLSEVDTTCDISNSLDLDAIIKEIINDANMSLKDHGVDIQYTINTTRPFYSEPIRIKQILCNLLSNGIKYSNPSQPHSFVKINVDEIDAGLQFSVKDNGIGIPKEYRDKLYQPFIRFHPSVAKGTGLGTTIIKKHIDAMSGSISLQSDEHGSEFTIHLPNKLNTHGA